jgi:hypothetical protein
MLYPSLFSLFAKAMTLSLDIVLLTISCGICVIDLDAAFSTNERRIAPGIVKIVQNEGNIDQPIVFQNPSQGIVL